MFTFWREGASRRLYLTPNGSGSVQATPALCGVWLDSKQQVAELNGEWAADVRLRTATREEVEMVASYCRTT